MHSYFIYFSLLVFFLIKISSLFKLLITVPSTTINLHSRPYKINMPYKINVITFAYHITDTNFTGIVITTL
jgi:hypothetical protein